MSLTHRTLTCYFLISMNYIQIIITILITAVITHYLTVYREHRQWNRTLELQKIQDYNKAADKFRSEFINTLYQLKKAEESPYLRLYKILPQFEKAKMQLEPYLSVHELKNLDSAWEEFAPLKPDNMLQYEALYSGELKAKCDLAIQRIEKLLECAKPK